MEVITTMVAAAGLAGSVLRYLEQLDGLKAAVKHGATDLAGAQARLVQHEQFINGMHIRKCNFALTYLTYG